MTENTSKTGSLGPLIALAVLIGVQLLLYATVFHRSRTELEELWVKGSPRERIWALHVLANRGDVDPDDYDAAFMRDLLAQEDLLVREMAFTSDICKMRPPEIQKDYLDNYVDADAHFLRSWILMRRKVGGAAVGAGLKIARKELEWLFMVEAGLTPPHDEMQVHFLERAFTVGVRKGLVDPETGEILRHADDPNQTENY